MNTQETESLQSTLDHQKDNFNAKADDQTKKVYQEGLDAIEESGITSSAKNIGDIAPNFTLKNAVGENVSLSSYLEKGAVILTWYRGGWCPYCNLTLHRLQQELPNFKAAGANLLALTPEVPDKSLSTSEKHQLDFEVLSDIDNQVGKEYGIVFKLTPEVAKIYEEKFGLSEYNGNQDNELPLAATYVINQQGEIIYAFIDIDYRKRAEPSDIINALKVK
ncbi:peroxiredoxin-like family protein [Flammeovirga agarivorans]|uniref:thioredoxin-dependent peroxiredoxin n=1 Tax=Flammeovirga agarivorans TaxID=2726742 RepID=A0A7X8SME1_9BACT|nr:peroxiredoxin-like family protein [Flammeovirga agarivorans]NLR92845.1 AhpC/TSA family protein [Flammeovirga agarivorans]